VYTYIQNSDIHTNFQTNGGVGAAVRGGRGCIYNTDTTNLLFINAFLRLNFRSKRPGILDFLCPGILKFEVGGLSLAYLLHGPLVHPHAHASTGITTVLEYGRI
jgi:hypothetical protein